MTEAERKLLIWCAIMLVRDTPLSPHEADEIDQLIVDVRNAWKRAPRITRLSRGSRSIKIEKSERPHD